MDKYTHYQAFECFGEDDEVEMGTPVTTEEEAIRFAEQGGVENFLVYRCFEVTAKSGAKWWLHASSAVYTSF